MRPTISRVTAPRTGDTRLLHEIVSTVASTLELDEVLSRTTLKLVGATPISPFGLFTLLRLRKAD